MGQITSRIVTPSDADVINGFATVWSDLGEPDSAVFTLSIGERQPLNITGDLEDMLGRQDVAQLVSGASTLISHATLNLTSINIRVVVRRAAEGTELELHFADRAASVSHLTAVRAVFHPFDGLPFLEGTIGPELGRFYEKREEALLRLESLAEDLIRRTHEYRTDLDEQFEARREALEGEIADQRAGLLQDQDRKEQAVAVRESALKERMQELDDRSNTHARRELREDLKGILRERNTAFSLTDDTKRKRWPIHALFILLTLVLGAFTVDLVFDQFNTQGSPSWPGLLRASLALVSFGATLAFYIRWSDRWANQHAEEEFRLRQLELDVDRASWVVEMALEWKEERDNQIPEELIQPLTHGLFERESTGGGIRHPGEDLASALLGASAGLTLRVPGVGNLVLDRRGLRRFRRAADEGMRQDGDS